MRRNKRNDLVLTGEDAILYERGKIVQLKKSDFADISVWKKLIEGLGYYSDDDRNEVVLWVKSSLFSND